MPNTHKTENAARLVILAGIGAMAGAASFTHMHDWTMANVPAGTGDWFGWANAMASELTPTVAVLDIRRRRRNNTSARFPTMVLVASVGLSLAAQFARAKPSVSGWLLAAIPAVAFIVLTKMVLTGAGKDAGEPLQDNDNATVSERDTSMPETPAQPVPVPVAVAPDLVSTSAGLPATSPTPAAAPTTSAEVPTVPAAVPSRPAMARVVVPTRPVARVNGSAAEVSA